MRSNIKIFDGEKIIEYRSGKESTEEYWENYFKNLIGLKIYNDVKLKGIGKLGEIMGKYFVHGGKILEGGCGKGELVYWLLENGFDCIGIDNNPKLIKRAKEILPDLPIIIGDVNGLPFKGSTFDGYYSGGVFEHFLQGPDRAVSEAYRVLKKGGILVSSTPFLNPIRYIKAHFFKSYPKEAHSSDLSFHQYLFSRKDWLSHYRRTGFNLIKIYYLAGYAGLYHEMRALRHLDDLGFVPSKLCRILDNSPIARLSGHSILCILQKV